MGLLTNLQMLYCISGLNEIVDKAKERVKDKIEEGNQEFENALLRCTEWSNERLIKEMQNTFSLAEKMAYMQEIKNRGLYSNESEE